MDSSKSMAVLITVVSGDILSSSSSCANLFGSVCRLENVYFYLITIFVTIVVYLIVRVSTGPLGRFILLTSGSLATLCDPVVPS